MKRPLSTLVYFSLLLFCFMAGCFHEKKTDPLTPEERSWLNKKSGNITINHETGWPPIIDTDKDGRPFGIAVDYYRLIENKLNFRFKLDKLDNWENVIKKLRENKIDVICEMQKNPERSRYAFFTKPYIEIPNAIIVRKEIKGTLSLDKMRDMKIAVSKGYAIHDYLRNNFDYLHLIPFDDDETCLLETSTKGVDAAVVNLAVASYLIESEGITNLRAAGYSGYKNALSIASRKDWPVLNRILNKGLALITEAERNTIYRKWIHLGYEPFYRKSRFWFVVSGGFLAIMGGILFVLLWNRSLRKLVEQRTEILANRTSALENEIAAREETEKELKRLQLYLENIFDSMPSVLVAVDQEGRVTQWNKEAERVTELPADEARGQPLDQVMPSLSFHMQTIRDAISTRTPQMKLKIPERVNHETRYADIMVYPLIANGVEGAVVRTDDVTDRVRIEQMMIQTEKMMSVGGLAAGMAHEINNPLGVIMQGVQNAIRRVSPDLKANQSVAEACGTDLETIRTYLEKRRILKYLDGMRDAGSRAAKIVSNMLTFSRRSESKLAPIEINALMDSVLELVDSDYDLKKKYDFRQVEIVREYEDGLDQVPCTATEIEQVFLNIIRNAAEAMAEVKGKKAPPRITIRTRKEENHALIEIEDNGPGMDAETCKRVFEPFFTTKPVGVGTGLGLSVSYFIVTNNHNGTLTVSSEPGKGIRFMIRLPLGRK